MGTWGVGIFSDDLASDVRDDYREHLGDGRPGPEATNRVLASHAEAFDDAEEGPVAWLALAAAQVQVGRLEERVRDRALALIDGGGDLERWSADARTQRKRAVTLAKLRDELVGPQRPPRKVPRPKRSVWPWGPGSVVAFRRDDGRRLLLRVVFTVGTEGVGGGRYGVVEVLAWIGDHFSDPAALAALPAAEPIDWSARDGHARLHGISLLDGRWKGRFEPIIERDGPGPDRPYGIPHFLIGAAELESLAERRFGLA